MNENKLSAYFIHLIFSYKSCFFLYILYKISTRPLFPLKYNNIHICVSDFLGFWEKNQWSTSEPNLKLYIYYK